MVPLYSHYYYIHTEIYSPKRREINFNSQIGIISTEPIKCRVLHVSRMEKTLRPIRGPPYHIFFTFEPYRGHFHSCLTGSIFFLFKTFAKIYKFALWSEKSNFFEKMNKKRLLVKHQQRLMLKAREQKYERKILIET